MAKLVYTEGGIEHEFVLDQGRAAYTIGRNPMCDLRINNPSISRKHAEIRVDAGSGKYSVHDLNSSNGTYVNGARVQHTELTDRDEILCGEFELLFFVSNAASTPRRRPPAPPSVPPNATGDTSALSGIEAPAGAGVMKPGASTSAMAVPPDAEAAIRAADERRLLPPSELQRELSAARAELKSLRLALQNESARAAEASNERARLSKDLQRAQDDLANARARLKQGGEDDDGVTAAMEQIQTLQAQLTAAKDAHKQTQNELDGFRDEAAAFKLESEQAQRTTASELARLRTEAERSREAINSQKSLEAEISSAQAEIAALNQKLATAEKRLTEVAGDSDATQAIVAELEAARKERDATKKDLALSAKALAAANEELAAAKRDREAAIADLAASKNEADASKEAAEADAATTAALREELEGARAQLIALEATVAEAQQKGTATVDATEITAVYSELEEKSAALKATQELIDELQENVATEQGNVAALTAELEDLKEKNVQMKAAFRDLSGELQELIQANRELVAKVEK